ADPIGPAAADRHRARADTGEAVTGRTGGGRDGAEGVEAVVHVDPGDRRLLLVDGDPADRGRSRVARVVGGRTGDRLVGPVAGEGVVVRADGHPGQRVGAAEVDGHRADVPAVRALGTAADRAGDGRRGPVQLHGHRVGTDQAGVVGGRTGDDLAGRLGADRHVRAYAGEPGTRVVVGGRELHGHRAVVPATRVRC